MFNNFRSFRSLIEVNPVKDASVVMVIESRESVFIRGQVIGRSLVSIAILDVHARFCSLFSSLFVKDRHADTTGSF